MSSGRICLKCGNLYSDENQTSCERCNSNDTELIQTSITNREYWDILQISRDGYFVKAMIELKEKDPIEYQLKMQQFKNQAKQQEQSNRPKCPTCNSTDLKKISGISKAGSIALWGVFAAGRTSKTWHCNNCGTEW